MPRSCSSSDMAGTFMLYPPGTDGAAVTDVRLPGSRSSQQPESRNTRCALTQWNPSFSASGGCPAAGRRPSEPVASEPGVEDDLGGVSLGVLAHAVERAGAHPQDQPPEVGRVPLDLGVEEAQSSALGPQELV